MTLSNPELERLDVVSALTPEYPQWMTPMRRGETMASRMAALREGTALGASPPEPH